jgi:hypothetical protein
MRASIHIDASPFAVKANRPHRCVETDFVAELEAVGKCFLRAEGKVRGHILNNKY